MNQNGVSSGTPDIVHVGITDGVYWTGSNVVGGKGNFNSGDRAESGVVSVKWDKMNLNDIIQFDKGSYVDVENHTSISLGINIDKDWSNGDSISVYCWDDSSSSVVGSEVFLEDYIDEFSFDVWQNAIIPFADLGLTTTDFDVLRFKHVSKGGGKSPKFYLDNIHVEELGEAIEYRTNTPKNTTYKIHKLVFSFADNVGSTVSNGTVPGLSFDKILGLSSLTNGIILKRVVKNKVTFSAPLRQLSDFIQFGFSITNNVSDGTNTFISLEAEFVDGLEVYGGNNSYLSLTIADDLSSLISFTAACRGVIEMK